MNFPLFLFASCCGRSPSLANHISKWKDFGVIFFLLRVADNHRPSQITFPSARILASFTFASCCGQSPSLANHISRYEISPVNFLLRVADNHRPLDSYFERSPIFCFVLRTITVPRNHIVKNPHNIFSLWCGQFQEQLFCLVLRLPFHQNTRF